MSAGKRYRAEPSRKTVMLEVGESLRQASRTGEAGSGGIGRGGTSAGRSLGRASGGERNANLSSPPAAEVSVDGGGPTGEAGGLERGEWPRQAALSAETRARSGPPTGVGGRGNGRGVGGRKGASEDARRAGVAGARGGSGMGGGSAAARGWAGDASLERLQREATSYRLWGAGGTAGATSAAAGAADADATQPATPPLKLPERFGSVEEYVGAFEPLLFEEARAQVASSWEEVDGGEGGGGRAGGSSAGVAVRVASLEATHRGWHEMLLQLLGEQQQQQGGRRAGWKEGEWKDGDVAVLSTARPAARDDDQSRSSPLQPPQQLRIAGIGRRCYEPMQDDRGAARATFIFTFHESALPPEYVALPPEYVALPPEYVALPPDEPVSLLNEVKSRNLPCTFMPVTSLTTAQREFSSLHSVAHLQPQMLEAVLRPGPHLFPDYVTEMPPDLSAVFPPAFCAHLQASFNAPQLQAIHWAAAHTAAHTPAAPASAAGTAASSRSGSGGAGGSSKGGWPFTLVQGPPGTGKTHTVWGMLNAIHLVHYQRYYHSLLAKLAPAASATFLPDDPPSAGAGSEGAGSAEAVVSGGGSIEDLLESMDQLAPRRQVRVARKPRMLVCAPSNAAVDELLSRVLSKGFLDGEMRTYRPDVARVGAEAATPAAQVERRGGVW
ncbi:unnamed protein product [Closterium sp. NIES-65]|nr:unnamed protein product [Closterium sp. NIES-65]